MFLKLYTHSLSQNPHATTKLSRSTYTTGARGFDSSPWPCFLCPFVCVVDGLAVRFAPYSQDGFSQTSHNQRIPSFFNFEFVF